MTTTPDYAAWLTKQQAADAMGVTTKSVERFVQAGQIQQARWQRDGRGPLLAVYHPDDVERMARERQRGPLPAFLVPASKDVSTNGNGHQAGMVARVPSAEVPSSNDLLLPGNDLLLPGNDLLLPGNDLLRVLVAAAARIMSETSQTPKPDTPWVDIPTAAGILGRSQAYVHRQIKAGALHAERDRCLVVRRKDLEAL